MKASLIYCQATDGSFAHTLQNTPTLHLKSHRDTQVSFLHVYCQCCNLWVCVCVCPQIARKRHKVINTFKSPLGQTRPPPPLKHITLMPLSQIRRVLDLQDTEGNTATAHTHTHCKTKTLLLITLSACHSRVFLVPVTQHNVGNQDKPTQAEAISQCVHSKTL